jgi:putative tryptophan/tyrosine transport system substrate-binding protein
MAVRSLRRRGFIVVLGGAAAWPLVGHAQRAEVMRRIGVLNAFPENDPVNRASVTAFTGALEHLGWVEGENIRIDYRFAAGDPTLFRTYAAELVGWSPNAILASNTPAVAALRQQTRTIPIVFVRVSDPVGQGFVQSLARPGGNVTGFSVYDAALMGKWVQLLKEVAPCVTRIAIMFNPGTAPYAALLNRGIETAAPSFEMTATLAPVHDDPEIEDAIAAQAREPGGGLIALPDSFTTSRRDMIIAAALRHRLPLIGASDVFPKAGGLMSYGFGLVDQYAQAASYIDRILKGASPADLPVQQPTKYTLIINLKTAEALGLTVPERLLALADEVIE